MTKTVHSIPERDLVGEAFDYALTKLLNEEAKQSVLLYFEIRHAMSLEGRARLEIKEIKKMLDDFFGTGSTLILSEFYKKLEELKQS